jgi:hypothetical protein
MLPPGEPILEHRGRGQSTFETLDSTAVAFHQSPDVKSGGTILFGGDCCPGEPHVQRPWGQSTFRRPVWLERNGVKSRE